MSETCLPGDQPGLLDVGVQVRTPGGRHAVVMWGRAASAWIAFTALVNAGPPESWRGSELTVDLSIPANFDRAIRVLATRIGAAVGASAPGFVRYGDEDGVSWILTDANGIEWDFAEDEWWAALAAETDAVRDPAQEWVVPGIAAVVEPAAALRLALLHTLVRPVASESA